MAIEHKRNPDVIGIDLNTAFAIIWRRRWLIAGGALTATLLAGLICFFMPKTYRSEGFYQLGNPKKVIIQKKEKFMTIQEKEKEKFLKDELVENKDFLGLPIPYYKNSSPQFFNPNRLLFFASLEKSLNIEDLQDIKNTFRTETDIGKWVKPIFAYTSEDTREFAQISRSEINSVIGLNLHYEADSPQKAQKYVWLLGNFFRDCLLDNALYDYIMDRYLTTKSELFQIENDIIDGTFALQQNSLKALTIKKILTKYPSSVKIENRQLVSIQDGGARFLSPLTQLVGIEAEMADQHQILNKMQREKDKLAIKLDYYSRCKAEMAGNRNQGVIFFNLLKSIKHEMFKKMDFNKDTVRRVSNSLNIDLQAFDLIFFFNCRFISEPTMPDKPIKLPIARIVVVTFILSTLFMLILAVTLAWWQEYKHAMMAGSEK